MRSHSAIRDGSVSFTLLPSQWVVYETQREREREREREAASWPAFSLLAPLAANVKLSIYHHAPRLTQDVFVCVSGFSLTLLDDFSAPKRYFWAVSLKLSRGK